VRPGQPYFAAIIGWVLLAWPAAPARAENLDDAWAAALSQNQRLAAAKMDEVAASENLGAAVAERMPSLSLRGAYTLRSDEPSFVVQDPLPGFGRFEFPVAERNAASAATEVRLPLYTGGRISNSIESAAARHAASEFATAQARLDLLFAVGDAYLGVLRLEREVEAAHLEWQCLEAHAADAARVEAQQRVSRGDALAAQVAASAAHQRWLQQQRRLAVARGQYNRLVGRPLTAAVQLEEPQFQPLPWNLQQLTQIACERRPDLQSLLATADSHELAASSVRGGQRPQVSASVGAQYEENRFAAPDSLATAAVIVDWNLYDGGRTHRLADAEGARAASTRCLVEDLKAQIAVDLLTAWNAAAEAAEQLRVSTQLVVQTAESLRTTQLRFAQGMALNTAVLEARSTAAAALRDERHARYQAAWAQLRLRYLAGLL
jgi:outer membrane protein TolC